MSARFVVAGVVALVLGAGVAAAATSGPAESRRAVEISLTEWRIDVDRERVTAGAVRVLQRNAGRLQHHLVMVRTDRPAEALPVGLHGPRPELAGDVVLGEPHGAHAHDGSDGPAHHLAPGAERRRTVPLRPGRYVLICTIPGHYRAGQHATLLVE